MDKFIPKFTITNRMTAAITQIERVRGFLDAAKLSKEWIEDIGNEALMKEAHHTTHIEGTQLTLDQAERLWNGKPVPEADPEDVRELLNYRSAFEFVSESLNNGDPITESLIREIHHHLVAGVRGGKATPGKYRQIQNYVVNSITGKVIYTPPSALDVPIMMSELVQWLNSNNEIHPVIASGIAQFQLVHIHPFLDGNGRTSRLLSTLCLYKAGYDFKRLFSISEYYDRDRPTFYKSIQSVRESNMDMTEWLDYFTTGLETQMIEVKKQGEQVIQRDILISKNGLNKRQGKALEYLFQQGKITIQDYQSLFPKVNRRTLQRDLKFMLDKELLISKGETNQLEYQLRK
ncbi:MAG: Fic family protein [Candidatus Cloacimonadales bacterium]|nr:Fic family protein [Candidatus Cloacimonadales bacterium]